MGNQSGSSQASVASRFGRALQLGIGVVCMAMIANLQYGWTLFVNPINDRFHWGKPAIQVAFTIFVLMETWLIPIEGFIVDRFGPSRITVLGGVLVACSWALNSIAQSLPVLYVAAALGGLGAGAVYGTCVGNALKWFPDRRGLAAGLTAMGFGAGSALTVLPISALIRQRGYAAAFLEVGLAQGLVVVALGWLLRAPSAAELARLPEPQHSSNQHSSNQRSNNERSSKAPAVDFAPLQMLRTPVFWVMYLIFVMMAAGGLMATAQLAVIAKDLNVADVPVSIAGLTLPALPFALSLDRVLNGVTRPFFGWVSDWLGRENTMFVAFLLEGGGILLLSRLGQDPRAFVILTGMVFFAWGEIYSLFPSTCGDTYGTRYATTNAGLLYTAKGTAALLVPLTSVLAASGGWHMVFGAAAALNISAAFLALCVLKPLRQRLRRTAQVVDERTLAAAQG